ncbi:hypothetical protein OG474_30010 [Kribbella sp. NBC_01505]|uniref:phage tail protein n=1 Tax=Kribbella sp. NBC_01505 TaxID=2903580 RepID=UPI00386E8818
MAQTQVIGRVAVKVLPDTSDFRRKAKVDLDRVEKTLPELAIHTRIDMSGASREMIAEVRKINQRNRMQDSRKIRFATTISTDGMNEEITKALRALSARANNRSLKIKTELVAATAVLELDQASLEHVQRELDDFRNQNDPLKIQVKPEMVLGATTVINKRLEFISRPRRVPLLPYVESSAAAKALTALAALSGARVLSSYLDDIAKSLSRLDKSVPIIGTLAEAIAGLGAFALASASNLFALSASLAQIAGASFVLPGIFGGLAIGIGSTIAVFKDFNKVLPQVKGQFAALQDQMSANFWKVAEQPIRNLVDHLFPELSSGLQTTASNLGGFFGALATELTSSFDGLLGNMFADLNASIGIAAGLTDSLAQSIATLGSVGAGYLPKLAAWFVDIAAKFNGWLTAAAADGRLVQWIDGGIFALNELGRVAAGIGATLGGLAEAAQQAGGSSLTGLADTLQRAADVVNGPTFQQALVGVFTSAHLAMDEITTQAGPAFEQFMLKLAGTLSSVLPEAGIAIGSLLDGIFGALAQPEVSAGLESMFAGLTAGVAGLIPALGPVAIALGSLMQVVGSLASVIGPVLGAAFAGLAQAGATLTPVLLPVIQLLGSGLAAALTAISPLIQQVVAAFSGLVGGPVMGALSGIIAALVPALSSIGGAVGKLLPLVAAVLGPLVEGIGQLVANVLPLVAEAFGKIVQAISPVLTLLGQLVGFLVPILVPILTFLAKILLESIVGAVQGAAKAIMGFVQILQGLWAIISGIFTGDWAKVWNGVKQVFSGVWDAITGIIQVAWNIGVIGALRKGWAAIKALWDLAGAGLKAAAAAIWAAIKGGVDGFFGGVKGLFAGALNFLKSLWKGGLDFLKSYAEGQWNLVKAIFNAAINVVKSSVSTGINAVRSAFGALGDLIGLAKRAWEGITGAFKSGVEKAIGFVRDLPGKAKDALSNIGTALIAAGTALIQGFINGIKKKFGDVQSTLGGLTSKLKDWKGPYSYDKVLLTPAGEAVIDGFIKGLESKYDAVRKSLAGLTSDIAGTAFDPPGFRSNVGSLSGAIDGALAGGGSGKTLIYNAAPGSSISSEEDLFAAADRSRMVF